MRGGDAAWGGDVARGGDFSQAKGSLAETIYLYSREVEHSDPNINALITYFEGELP